MRFHFHDVGKLNPHHHHEYQNGSLSCMSTLQNIRYANPDDHCPMVKAMTVHSLWHVSKVQSQMDVFSQLLHRYVQMHRLACLQVFVLKGDHILQIFQLQNTHHRFQMDMLSLY